MATIIQIKRSTGAGAPTTANLSEAELAYSQDKSNDGANAILYIESVNNDDSPIIHKVGGKYYTDLVDGATEDPTNSTLVKRGANGSFSANVVSANEFIGAFSGTISGKATSAGIADTANALTTARDITLVGDVTGTASFDGSQNISITTTANVNSVQLGVDTLGNYVNNVDAGTGITASGGGVENSNVTISLADTAVTPTTYGGTDKVGVFTVDQQGRITNAANAIITVLLGTNTDGNYVDNVVSGTGITASGGGSEASTVTISLADTAVTPTTYGGADQIPAITVDQQGRITGATNVSISSSFTIAADSGANDTFNTGGTLTFTGGTGIATSVSDDTITITNQGVTSISGTTNEIEVSASNASVTIGLPNNVTIGNDLTVTGNLYVTGTAVTVSTDSLSINDPLIHLANNNTSSDVVDIGFEGHYFDAVQGQRHAGLFRDASDGKFKFFANVAAELENATTIDPASNGFTIASLVANLEGGTVSSLTAAINVADGGTGNTTFTTNGVLVGQGTSAITAKTGSSGEVLQIDGSGIPIFASIDGGTY